MDKVAVRQSGLRRQPPSLETSPACLVACPTYPPRMPRHTPPSHPRGRLVASAARPPETLTTTPATASWLRLPGLLPPPLQSGSPLIAAAPYRNTPMRLLFSGGAMSSSVDVRQRGSRPARRWHHRGPCCTGAQGLDNFVTRLMARLRTVTPFAPVSLKTSRRWRTSRKSETSRSGSGCFPAGP